MITKKETLRIAELYKEIREIRNPHAEERRKEQAKNYRLKNIDRIKIVEKEWRLKNSDKLKQYHKGYRLKHKDSIRKHMREYYHRRKLDGKS